MRLIPVYLCKPHAASGKSYPGNTLELAQLPGPYIRRRRGSSWMPCPRAMISMLVISPMISKFIEQLLCRLHGDCIEFSAGPSIMDGHPF